MRICAYCDQELKIHQGHEWNVEMYGGFRLTKTLCCGKPYQIKRVVMIEAIPVNTENTEDDWGSEFNVN